MPVLFLYQENETDNHVGRRGQIKWAVQQYMATIFKFYPSHP